MKKYEYKAIEFFGNETIQDDDLRKLGYDGWELAAIENTDFGKRFYFKREIL